MGSDPKYTPGYDVLGRVLVQRRHIDVLAFELLAIAHDAHSASEAFDYIKVDPKIAKPLEASKVCRSSYKMPDLRGGPTNRKMKYLATPQLLADHAKLQTLHA